MSAFRTTFSTLFPTAQRPFLAYGLLVLLSVLAAVLWYQPLFLALPVLPLLVLQTLIGYKKIFYLLIACIPISVEVNFSASLGTDIPFEPLVIGLMLAYIANLLTNFRGKWSLQVVGHPLILLLLLHFGWSLAATIGSESQVLSIKWMLAKFWYIITFVFVAIECLRETRDYKWLYWSLVPLLVATVLYTLVRQALNGFAFDAVNDALHPFYRNHVNYAATLAIALPFLWYGRQWFSRRIAAQAVWLAIVVIVFLGVQFAYTRAAYVSLLLAVAAYWVVRWRLMRLALLSVSIVATIGVGWLIYDNNFLKIAPQYEKTVTQDNFNDLVTATAQGKDISTMERVNRWVAGGRMVAIHPGMGFGPSTFYTFYKKYLLARFRTYVSVNDEKSTVHCYFLLMLIEQGIPGFLLFIALVFGILLHGERIYHQTTDPTRRRIVLAALLSEVVIIGFLLINDMLETDKVGSFFFLNIAILVNMDMLTRRKV